MALWLRKPAWAPAVVLEGVAGVEQGGWIVIDRLWQQGLRFTLHIASPVRAEPYPGGGIAVLRGPLQFVQPIRHRARALRSLALENWHDEELLPVDVAEVAAAIPVLDRSVADLGFETVREVSRDPDDPWGGAPIHLVTEGTVLVPMGCAPLRRSMFLPRE
jgi:DUF1680 family protein